MAAAVQVEVVEDNAAMAVCEPTPVAMEAFGCTDDDEITDVVVVAVEVVIVIVVDDASNILYYCVRKLQRILTDLITVGVCRDLVADLLIKRHETTSLLNPFVRYQVLYACHHQARYYTFSMKNK